MAGCQDRGAHKNFMRFLVYRYLLAPPGSLGTYGKNAYTEQQAAKIKQLVTKIATEFFGFGRNRASEAFPNERAELYKLLSCRNCNRTMMHKEYFQVSKKTWAM